tara:strand:- start:2462 stop:3034 length:573 start_codon:yes stop_codon:yes gene_type:complete
MRYYIFPGSFKPPHKGHIKILINIIKKQKNKDFKIIIIISKKGRKLNNKTKKIVSAQQSLKIFKIYINELNKNFKLNNNIKVSISKKSSPLLNIYPIIKKINKKSNKVFLIKSKKDKNNKRFDMFSRIKNLKVMPFKELKDFHSTNFRKVIYDKNMDLVKKYILNNISKDNLSKIFSILKLRTNLRRKIM